MTEEGRYHPDNMMCQEMKGYEGDGNAHDLGDMHETESQWFQIKPQERVYYGHIDNDLNHHNDDRDHTDWLKRWSGWSS